MGNISINECFNEIQRSSWIRDQIDEYSVDMIYCPMCEVIHENNTNCQRND